MSACQSASCTGSGFNRVDATYDGSGHRTQLKETTTGGVVTTTTFAYQADAIVSESVNGTVAKTYVVDDAGRITKVCVPDCTGTNPVYLVIWNGHGDALGLWRQNADGSLTLANSYQYSTWGTPTTTPAPGFTDLGFRFLYVGASDVQWDNSFGLGLLYMHTRHYRPGIGRFLQPDPADAEGNLFEYAGNSPVGNADDSGTYWYPVKAGDTIRTVANRIDHHYSWRARIRILRSFNSVLHGVSYNMKLPAGLCLLVTDEFNRSNRFEDPWFAWGHCTGFGFSAWSPSYPAGVHPFQTGFSWSFLPCNIGLFVTGLGLYLLALIDVGMMLAEEGVTAGTASPAVMMQFAVAWYGGNQGTSNIRDSYNCGQHL